jgi:uncharacterized protein YndB with AHSA1/START domain
MVQIKLSIAIEALPEKVFPLVATAGGFRQWWAADVIEDDNVAELGFFNRTTVYRLRLARSVGPRDAEWHCLTGQEWSGTRLCFDLTHSNGKTLVRFTHAGWTTETDYFVACTATWGELMYRLKATVEGKAPGPLFSANGLAY